jgi:dsDNA-binding SOS-regulon protein
MRKFTTLGTPKYKAVRITHSGHSFASKLEAALFDELTLMEKGGLITEIKCQPHVFLTEARIEMIPDFLATDQNGVINYYEAKGYETDVWRIKRRLWKCYGPGTLHVYKGTAKKLRLYESIVPL